MAMIVAVQITLVLQTLWQEITGTVIEVHVFSAASAALGAAERLGLMRFKHMALKWLFLKELILRRAIVLHKIGTRDNCADFLTKAVSASILQKNLDDLNCFECGGA